MELNTVSSFQPGDRIKFNGDGFHPVVTVQEVVDGYYILINANGDKFLRSVINTEIQFELLAGTGRVK